MLHADLYRRNFDEEETIEEYTARMRRDGEWGDGWLFGAISNLFNSQIDIYIVEKLVFSEGDKPHLFPSNLLEILIISVKESEYHHSASKICVI